MFEKVNPAHPDKIADRIAGAIVDLAYEQAENPKIAVEVLLGHGVGYILVESDIEIEDDKINETACRIAGNMTFLIGNIPQDAILSKNQEHGIRCGDNGIFRGVPVTDEQRKLSNIAKDLYAICPRDGKYLLDGERLIICHSGKVNKTMRALFPDADINPLGEWTGGTDVDSGATNRKLGSDMADSVTGGGLHGKDLSKADVSVNIYAWLKAQETGKPVELSCAIGDDTIDGRPYSEIVEIARDYITRIGGFEKFAEWGLV